MMMAFHIAQLVAVGSIAAFVSAGAEPPRALRGETPASETKSKKRYSCSQWSGTASGNDPSVQVAASLCEAKDGGVIGLVTWNSERSGFSVRKVEGSWSSDHKTLTFADVDFVENKPNLGWRFCLIDRYRLTSGGASKLEGGYRSSKCNDDATMQLKKVK
ncbi:MAG: hypothetical protein HOW73_35110 [Polyangiaceae bacterium]|nr:hypothetical protein [Polyangiaceae bacterium]